MSSTSVKSPSERPEQIRALAGLRGCGFLLVFFGHYLANLIIDHRANKWDDAFYYIAQLDWLAVPAFFVLSGYLIGGILYRTRNRQGFFRVFYGRRALRVLPVYYITILVVAFVDLAHGIHLDYRYWVHFIYIQNFMPGYCNTDPAPNNQIVHLWSLAVEEQFYITWPIVVWFAKDRKTLLKIVVAICAGCWLLRVISPLVHLSVTRIYYATPTRIDTILFGVGLALVADHSLYKRLQPLAKYVALAGMALWLISSATHPNTPNTYLRVTVEYTIANVTVLAIIVAALEEGSGLARFLSARWACWLGQMSYGLYVFHYTFYMWFLYTVQPTLRRYMPAPAAFLVMLTAALALTIALGMLSLRFIEQPALSLKRYLPYGREDTARSVASSAEKEIGFLQPAAVREGLGQD